MGIGEQLELEKTGRIDPEGNVEDIKTMTEMLAGLKTKRKNLLTNEKAFLRVAGINEEIEKAAQDKLPVEKKMNEAKRRRDEFKKKKSTAVSKTTEAIAKTMNTVLPFGKAVFSYDEDDNEKRKLFIGWRANNGRGENIVTPYNGLSGSEKQIFDAALARVLNASVIVVEAAELDSKSLEASLKELGKLDAQCLVATCHPVDKIPESFTKIIVGK